MKATKKLKKVMCTGVAGCLILGCLAGCGDGKESSDRKPKKVTSEPQEKVVFSSPGVSNCRS